METTPIKPAKIIKEENNKPIHDPLRQPPIFPEDLEEKEIQKFKGKILLPDQEKEKPQDLLERQKENKPNRLKDSAQKMFSPLEESVAYRYVPEPEPEPTPDPEPEPEPKPEQEPEPNPWCPLPIPDTDEKHIPLSKPDRTKM